MLELSNKDFKAAFIKKLPQVIVNTLKTNEKQTLSARNRRYKEESGGNSRTENYNSQKIKSMNSLTEEKVYVMIEQQERGKID